MITTKQLVPNIWCIVRKSGAREEYWNGRTFCRAFGLAETFESSDKATARLRQIRRRVNAAR